MKLKPSTRAISLYVLSLALVIGCVCFSLLIGPPRIKTWDDLPEGGLQGPFSTWWIERQIRALDERDPSFEAMKCRTTGDSSFYAVFSKENRQVPGIEPDSVVDLESLFPIKVIAGTGGGAGERQEELDRLAREFAKKYNREMYGRILTD